jgi:hypothetical protein
VHGGGAWPPAATSPSPAPSSANSLDGVPALLPAQPVSQGQTATPTPAVGGGWTSTTATSALPSSQPAATTITPSATDATFAPANAPPHGDAPASSGSWVNSLTFDLDYDIQTVGPWGVAKVELWGTKDGGRQWQALGVDQDNRSPMRVTVPGAGVYGFRILVDGGNGAAAATPQPGDAPELIVGVDLAAPHAELRAAEPGQGAFAGQLLIRWTAQDENLAPRPIGLFSAAAAEGPWTTIATDLENSGEYAWRLGRDAPPRVFLRLEARDIAGNVEVIQSPTPVDLNVPRPTGRLRNVRPVEADPDRYRTASGARPAEG